jgi:hypothetical protein
LVLQGRKAHKVRKVLKDLLVLKDLKATLV